MDTESLKVWLMVITLLSTAGQGVWLILKERSDKTDERVSALAVKVDKLDKDVTGLEATIGSSPTHQDLGALHERINAVAKGVDTLAGEFAGVKNVVNLIHEHLLRGKN